MTWSSDLLQLANIKTLLRQAINGKSPGALDENDSFRDYVDAVDNIPVSSGESGGIIGSFYNLPSGITIMADGTVNGFTSNVNQLFQYFKKLGINTMFVRNIDLKVRFRLTSTPSGTQNIFGIRNLLTPDIDGDLKVKLWNFGAQAYNYESPAITLNQWVIFKCHVDISGGDSGSTCVYTPSISLDDGTTWIDGTPFTSTSTNVSVNIASFRNASNATFMFGNTPSSSDSSTGDSRSFMSGEIDIYGSELKVDGNTIYGYNGKKLVEGPIKLIRNGADIEYGIASDFTSYNYIYANRTNFPLESTVNNIEIVSNFALTATSNRQTVICWDKVFTCELQTNNGLQMSVWNYATEARQGYYGSFVVDTPYYVKCYIDWATKTKTISISEDGETWTELVSFVDSGMAYYDPATQNPDNIYIGVRNWLDRPLQGYVDLRNTYVKINNVLQIGYEEV